ncbi:hypothetical protein L195_g047100, partial [Trifolium pratense]
NGEGFELANRWLLLTLAPQLQPLMPCHAPPLSPLQHNYHPPSSESTPNPNGHITHKDKRQDMITISNPVSIERLVRQQDMISLL